jgi:citrate synthase
MINIVSRKILEVQNCRKSRISTTGDILDLYNGLLFTSQENHNIAQQLQRHRGNPHEAHICFPKRQLPRSSLLMMMMMMMTISMLAKRDFTYYTLF